MIRVPVTDLPAQCAVLPDGAALTATMLIPGTTVTVPWLGLLVIVTVVASGLHLASQERSSTSSDCTPEAAERVSLISWAKAPAAVNTGGATAARSAPMTVRAH